MRTRLHRVIITVVVLAAMALSTGAGIRWGYSSMVPPPPPDYEVMVVDGGGE